MLHLCYGAVAELVDAADLKSAEGDLVWVRVPPALYCEKGSERVERSSDTAHFLFWVNQV